MITYKKGVSTQLSTHFNALEFACPCTVCAVTLIEPYLVSLLESTRTILGKSIKINSGYRCPAHQLSLEAMGYPTVKNSQHLVGGAADIQAEGIGGVDLEKAARRAGFKAVGVAETWCHVDIRPDNHSWKY